VTTTDAAAAAIESAYQLLGLIFEANDLIEFRTIGGPGGLRDWVPQAKASRVIAQLAATVAKGQHVYFGANPRSGRGGKATDVALARCLFADFDGGTTVEQARMAWREANIPEPTVVVQTGGGIHAWWRLAEPMTDLAEWTRYQKALAHRLGSDSSVTDAPRVMRLPGFVNWKYAHQPLCVVHESEADHLWTLDEFPAPQEGGTVLMPPAATPVAGSLSDLSRRFLEEGFIMRQGRRTTVFTVACDMKARGWSIAEAGPRIMARAATLGLTADELIDLNQRQIPNAFAAERKAVSGPAEAVQAVEPPPAAPAARLQPVPICALVARCPELRRPVIEGLLRTGETLNLISSPKMGKSFLVNQLAICVARGEPWMGFQIPKAGRVLIVDNELHPETSADRIPKLCAAQGIPFESLADRLDILNLRGDLVDFDGLGARLFDHCAAGQYTVVILDAFYRFLPARTDENDNGSMARIYNQVDKWARTLDCAFVMIHHTSKGDQAGKGVTDVGAGAGSMSRAADSHLILRHHREEGHVVLDAAVRSFAPIEPRVLRWAYPLFHMAPHLDPKDLAKPGKKDADDDGWSAQRFVEECFRVETKQANGATVWLDREAMSGAELRATAEAMKLTKGRAESLRTLALGSGLIEKQGSTKGVIWVRRTHPAAVNNSNGDA
jgi:hypothetical protein